MDIKPSNPNPNPNPNPLKPKLAFHFLKALDRIKQRAPTSSSPPGRRISRAAYTSMACAAGPRRAWSRALLRRLRGRPGRPIFVHRRIRVARQQRNEPRRAGDLRRLLPGGQGMEFCSLLEETANYIQCLSTQVQLMQSVLDSVDPHQIQEP